MLYIYDKMQNKTKYIHQRRKLEAATDILRYIRYCTLAASLPSDVKTLEVTGHLKLRKLTKALYNGLKKSMVWKAMASFLKLVNSAGLLAYSQSPQPFTNT